MITQPKTFYSFHTDSDGDGDECEKGELKVPDREPKSKKVVVVKKRHSVAVEKPVHL